MTTDTAPAWAVVFEQVPRAGFIPDTIWVDDPDGPGFTAVSRRTDPSAWEAAVAANAPVITQINLGEPATENGEDFPSSSSSQPSIVADMLDALDPRPGERVLEIGTGTGWNAALLAHRVGPSGQVTTIEVDPALAETARQALTAAGVAAEAVTGDGAAGWPAGAPFDRIIATASVREIVPPAWLAQLRPGGRLVTPWGTDYGNGALLTLDLDADGIASGRFSGNLAFMRLRSHQRSLFGWEPDDDTVAAAEVAATDVRGKDLDMMLNPEKGRFAIGARLPNVALVVEWDAHGPGRHVLELDDLITRSYARLDADVTDPAPFTVRQLGPRRLWDEALAAYDWWHEHAKPGPDRLGLAITDDAQTLFLDTPETVVRTWP
ncbi:methyltransferase domain-containing protein [Amycolatopsis rubida]|uniref:Protein-L-isoaspartate O-methyltransferase n=1 Tax=Amycolatopsis rubida TaxID=112413 RepID=A0A1I5X552_9PSEU|nr:methyltransferase domain-containing protein [Amycolatopsis rubida]SFQ27080.1 protein-L-isoaspartate(D-aspartate) O-methyltransferase [Amycolatopsis rubida]